MQTLGRPSVISVGIKSTKFFRTPTRYEKELPKTRILVTKNNSASTVTELGVPTVAQW